MQERVTGTVRLKLFKGACQVVGRTSPFALYDHGLATYDAGDLFDHRAAVGFIKICGPPDRDDDEEGKGRGGDVVDYCRKPIASCRLKGILSRWPRRLTAGGA